MKQEFTRQRLRALQLSQREQLILSTFVVTHPNWVMRHAVPLEVILRAVLRRHGMELRRFQQVEPHPVYELWLRRGRSGPATKAEIEFAVRRAFATAGHAVRREYIRAVIREDRAQVVVYAEG